METEYLGLTLRNPSVASSSGLTSSVEKLKRLEEAGAGAVVLKSVFEEQIVNETVHLDHYSAYSEAAEYLQFYLKEDYLGKYLELIAGAKKELDIPVIASICCLSQGQWVDFAKRIEASGADALELNVFILPTREDESAREIESRYLAIVGSVTAAVKIPVAVKIGSRFTNPLEIVKGIVHRNARGVVMFNRFYEPDIDIESLDVTESGVFSSSSELRNSIRWIAMASARFPRLDIAASTGVHTGADAVKVMLAGASVYELCSVLYKEGPGALAKINRFVEEWMTRRGFGSAQEFVGKVNYSRVPDTLAYERAQFMRYFASKEI